MRSAAFRRRETHRFSAAASGPAFFQKVFVNRRRYCRVSVSHLLADVDQIFTLLELDAPERVQRRETNHCFQ